MGLPVGSRICILTCFHPKHCRDLAICILLSKTTHSWPCADSIPVGKVCWVTQQLCPGCCIVGIHVPEGLGACNCIVKYCLRKAHCITWTPKFDSQTTHPTAKVRQDAQLWACAQIEAQPHDRG